MKRKIIRAFALLLSLSLCVSGMAGCKKDIDTDGVSSFSMGDFTINGNGDADGENATDGTDGTGDGANTTGGNNGGGSTSTDNGKTTSLTAEQVLKKMPTPKVKELKVCCWEDYRNTAYANALEAFEKKTGVKVKPQIITKASYDSEVAALISAGNSPDLVLMIQTTTSSMKNLQPISNSGYNFNDTAWDQDVMNAFKVGGKNYAMSVKNTPKQNVCVILYNKKALKKAEMQDPYQIWKKNPKDWTWDKLWSMCETFLTKNKNKEGYSGIGFGIEDGYLRSFNAGLYGFNSQTGKYQSYINEKQTAERYTILMDKIEKKLASSTWDKNSFVMGYTLFAMTYSSALEKANTNFSQLDGNLGSVPVPTDSTSVPGFEYCAWGIPIGAKNAEIAPYFVRWTFGPDLYDMSNFYKDEQSKTTVEDMISRGKTCMISGWRWDVWNALTTGGSAQVKTVLDTYSAAIDDLVAIENSALETLQK